GIRAAYTSKQLSGKIAANDAIGRSVQRSFHAGRSGDVMLVLESYCLLTSKLTGTTHGTPHPYDTHVPLLVFGPGVKPGIRKERVSPAATAVILAEALGLKPPAKATVKVPEHLFEKTTR